MIRYDQWRCLWEIQVIPVFYIQKTKAFQTLKHHDYQRCHFTHPERSPPHQPRGIDLHTFSCKQPQARKLSADSSTDGTYVRDAALWSSSTQRNGWQFHSYGSFSQQPASHGSTTNINNWEAESKPCKLRKKIVWRGSRPLTARIFPNM
jgi:hypothetical protein